MALNGTLTDMKTIDLVQYPHAGRKTGELVVASPSGEGRLYYQRGRLSHAALGDKSGMEALIEVLGWTEGEFEFRLGVETDRSTIELDLHRAVMHALKLRDERQAEQRQSSSNDERARVESELRAFIGATPSILHAALLSPDGATVGQAAGEDAPADAAATQRSLQALLASYPRVPVKRVFVEDPSGMVVLTRLASGRVLVVMSDTRAPLGAIAMQTGKFALALDGDAS